MSGAEKAAPGVISTESGKMEWATDAAFSFSNYITKRRNVSSMVRQTETRQRPGVILYFDTLCPALARLTDEDSGKLLRGIVDYVQTGALPELEGMPGMAFDLLRPGIDRDGDRYEYQCLHGQYMAYCRKTKERGEPLITEEEYIQQLTDTASNYQLPTTTPSPSPSQNSTLPQKPTPSLNPTASPAEVSEEEEGESKGDGEGDTAFEQRKQVAIKALLNHK